MKNGEPKKAEEFEKKIDLSETLSTSVSKVLEYKFGIEISKFKMAAPN